MVSFLEGEKKFVEVKADQQEKLSGILDNLSATLRNTTTFRL